MKIQKMNGLASKLTAALLVISGTSAFATSATWNGSADASWSDASNWNNTVVPGATGTTNNGDTAVFNTASPTYGTGANPVIIDSGRNILNLTFSLAAGPYVIGSTSGNALTISSGGTIQDASTMTSSSLETINAPLTIESGTTTISNNSGTLAGLQVKGTITADQTPITPFASTLALSGTNTSTNNIISGVIDGGASGTTLAITKSGTGYWDITGNNSDLGQTTTISGGTLSIGNSNALGIGNISLSGGSLAADSALTLGNNFVQGTFGTAASVSGANNITTSGTLTFNGTTGVPSLFVNNLTGGATFATTGLTTLSTSGTIIGDTRFTGPGNTSLMDISGGTTSSLGSTLGYYGTGTFTLNGTDNIVGGAQNLLGGTVVLNYGAGSDSGPRLETAGNLFLGSNLVLSGGTNNLTTLGSTTVATNSGATYYATISASPGSGNTIALGTLASGGNGTLNIQPGVATTTSASSASYGTYGSGSVGLLNAGWVTVGNGFTEDFATTLSTATGTATPIVAVPTYYYVLHTTNGINQGVSLTPNAAGTSYTDTNTGNYGNPWKIDTSNGTSAGTYNMLRPSAAANFFGTENILYTGFANYTLAGNPMYQNEGSAGGTSSGNINLTSYGTGTLTISSQIYGGVYIGGFTGAGGTFTGVYGGNGNLLKSGTGTIVLSGVNNYVGNTEIAEGTLSISSDSNLGGVSGNLTVVSSSTSSKTVTVSATGFPTSLTLVGSTFLGSTITGQAAPSGGNVVLTLAANANTTASSGTYNYANGSQALLMNGTLQATGSFTLGETASSGGTGGTVTNYRPVYISVDGATFDVTGANVLTAPGVISAASGTGVTGDVTLTKIDTGTLVLSGADTYTGGTFVNGGTLELSFNTADGAPPASNILASTGALTLGGGTLNVNGAATAIANSQTIASLALTGGNSTISLTPNSATSVGLTFTNGNLTRVAGSTIDFVPGTGTSVTLSGNTNNPFLGNYAFYGTGSTEGYAATGSTGAVQLAATTAATGVNNFTSAAANYAYTSPGTPDTLTASRTANTAVFNTAGVQTIDLGASGSNTLTLNGFINDGGALTIQRTGGTGTLAIGSGNELVIGGASNVTISAPISGAGGALTDANANTLTLSGVNTYTGATTVNSGTLSLSGTLNGSNVTTSASGAGVVTETSAGVIAGSGTTFTQASTGTSTLSGINTYTGLTTVSNGELDLGSSGQAIAGNLAVYGGTAKLLSGNQMKTTSSVSVYGGTFNLQSFSQTLAGVQLAGGTISGTGTLTSTSAFDVEQGVASAILAGTAGLTKTTTGTVVLSAANTYTGTTTISAGTLYASALSNLGASTNAVVLGDSSNTGTLSYTGSALSFTRGFTVNAGGGEIDNGNGLLTIATGNIVDTSGGLTTLGGVGSMTVNSVIGGGSGGVTVNLDGTLTLTGLNTYTGATTINAGVVSVSNIVVSGGASNLGNATSAVFINDGADLSYTGTSATYTRGFTIGSVGGEIDTTTSGQTLTIATGGVNDSSGGTVTFGGTGNTTVTSVIGGGAGGLTKIGTGTVALSGANTYTGTTTITAGTLQLGNGGTTGTLSTSSAIVDNSTLAINRSNTVTQGTDFSAAAITGTGGITQAGTGTTILNNANTNTGATTVNAGTLQEGFSSAHASNILAATSALKLGGGTLNLNGSSTATANTQTLASMAVTAGNSTVSLTKNTATSVGLTFTSGTITRTAGSTVDFVSPTSTSITLTGNNSNAFLGSYAFFGTGANQTYAATSSAGVVQAAALTSATGVNSFTSSTANYSYVSPGTPDILTGAATANTADFNTSGAQTIDLGSTGTNTLTLNGLLNTGGALTIQRSGGTGTVAIGSANELVVGGGSNVTISAPISGSGAVTDSNTGTLTLSGTNTYTGITTVNSGTLLANGTATSTGTGNVVVANGATLGGTGVIAPNSGSLVTVQSGGTLNPGGTPSGTVPNGNLTLAANAANTLTLSSGANLTFNLGTSNTSSALILSINTPGEVAFNGNTVSINDLTSGSLSGNYILFAPGTSNPSGNDYTGLTLNGSGQITGGLLLSSSVTSIPGYTSSYLFENTTNGDIELSISAVPEPGTWALMLLGLMVLAGYRYRQEMFCRRQAIS